MPTAKPGDGNATTKAMKDQTGTSGGSNRHADRKA
jgi:hypothetical protein